MMTDKQMDFLEDDLAADGAKVEVEEKLAAGAAAPNAGAAQAAGAAATGAAAAAGAGAGMSGIAFIAAGVAMLAVAFVIVGGSVYDAMHATDGQDEVLETIDEVAQGEAEGELGQDAAEAKAANDGANLVIDGVTYAGVLEIPSLSLRLPVQATYDATAVKSSPCIFSGGAADGNLVITGHNYPAHFGTLQQLSVGDEATFMDVLGVVYSYKVVAVDVLGATSVDEMTQGSSAWDLTLFTCTFDGDSRTTIRLSRTSISTM